MRKQQLYIPIPEKKDWKKAKKMASGAYKKPLNWLDHQAEKAINKMAEKALQRLAKKAGKTK